MPDRAAGQESRAPDTRAVGIASIVLTAIVLVFSTLIATQPGQEDNFGKFLFLLLLCLAVAVVVFEWLIPKAIREDRQPARMGMALSGVAAVTVLLFWTGLPFVLAPAGAVLGRAGELHPGQGEDSGLGRAAWIVGLIALVVALLLVLRAEFR